jgi:rhodanese-related sulfurtransferase
MKLQTCLLSMLLAVGILASGQSMYKEITLPELMKKKKQGESNMVIVDVRTRGEYHDTTSRGMQSNIGRIKDAINIPLQDLQQKREAITQLEAYKDKEIYLVCSHSYRSRSASRILLKNGFTHVTNVQGGMTEWYRRYNDLAGYRKDFFETTVPYRNYSPAEVLDALIAGKKIQVIGVKARPQFWYDTFNLKLYRYLPMLKQMRVVNYADSLDLLAQLQKNPEGPVVLFNLVNNGAAELADWLTSKGIKGAGYLVGGLNLFYEYASNQTGREKLSKWLVEQSRIRFITPMEYCTMVQNNPSQLVDLRHDTLFNKINSGVKHDFRHMKNALNFFYARGAQEFEQAFADKSKVYVLVSDNVDALPFANELSEKGYRVAWILGGLDRWEWYMNNVEGFRCNESLVEK